MSQIFTVTIYCFSYPLYNVHYFAVKQYYNLRQTILSLKTNNRIIDLTQKIFQKIWNMFFL